MRTASTQDGAFAWLLCVMSFLNHVIIGGFIYASGMFYLMFKKSLDVTDSELALITSINIGVMFAICPVVGILCDHFGSRLAALGAGFISTVGLACSAFSTQILHLYISYGIIAGAGQGILMIISITVLDPYFKKYKRIACSIALSGFGVGSFIIPPVLTFLENMYGWRGAILLLAGINAHVMVTCSLYRPFVTAPKLNHCPHMPDSALQKYEERPLENIDMQAFKDVPHSEVNPGLASSIKRKVLEILSLLRVIPFLCLGACSLFVVFTMSIISTHFGNYMLTLQFTSEDVVKLYMALGVAATVGRPLAGTIAEITHANTAMYIMLTMLLNGMMTLCLPLMKELWMLYVYVVLYQLLLGPWLGLGGSSSMEHVPKSEVATAYGLYCFFSVPGFILGAPMAAWMYEYTHMYAHSFYFAGGLMILSGLVMVPSAYYIHKEKTSYQISDASAVIQPDF